MIFSSILTKLLVKPSAMLALFLLPLSAFANQVINVEQKTSVYTIKTVGIKLTASSIIENRSGELSIYIPTIEFGEELYAVSKNSGEGVCAFFDRQYKSHETMNVAQWNNGQKKVPVATLNGKGSLSNTDDSQVVMKMIVCHSN